MRQAGGGLQRSQQAVKASERQSHHVEVATLDTSDEFSGAALDGVGAGFSHGLAGRHVGGDLLRAERREGDACGLDSGNEAGAPVRRREVQQSDAGEDSVRLAGEEAEHAAGIAWRGGFAEDLAAEDNDRVGAEDEGGGGDALRAGEGFFAREPDDVMCRGLAAAEGFVEASGPGDKGEASLAKNLGASWRGGGEDQAVMASGKHRVGRRRNGS